MTEHKVPEEPIECLVCMEDIDSSNYVEFKVSNDSQWTKCMICETCVELFLRDSMPNYRKNLIEADCRASQLRVLSLGPPIYVKDDSVFPCHEGEHIEKLWYSSSNEEKSGKVYGCLEGEERENWWNEMKEALSITEEELKEKEKWGMKEDKK